QVALAQALHDRLGLDTAVLHRNARAAHQVTVAAFVEHLGQFGPEHGDGRAVTVTRIDAGSADFQHRSIQMRQAVQLELTFTVETPEAAGGLVIEQAGGGDQAPAVKIAHADVCAMGVELISVQTAFGAFQACLQRSEERRVGKERAAESSHSAYEKRS